MSTRRELLKALPALVGVPLVVKGEDVGRAFKIEPDAKYVVFVNVWLVDLREFCEHNEAIPPGTVVHAVQPNGDQSMDDVIRIYKTT
jgi:hypothetical protein